MRIKYKFSVVVAIAIAISVFGATIMQTRQTIVLSRSLNVALLGQMTDYWGEYWSGRINGHFRVLRALADAMGGFEEILQERRRDILEAMMLAALEGNPVFFGLNMVFLPDAIDYDADNIGREGATESGQFATGFWKELDGGGIEHRALADGARNDMMAHLTGPFARNDRAEDPEPRFVPWRGEIYLVRISVPIYNQGVGQPIGILSALLELNLIQDAFEYFLEMHPEITALGLYSSNGHTIGNSNPQAITRNISERSELFGDLLPQMVQATAAGENFQASFFSPESRRDMEIAFRSFELGTDTGMTWSVTLAIAEETFMGPIFAMVRNALLFVALLVAAIIFACTIYFAKATKPLVWLERELRVLAEGDFTDVELLKYSGKDEISNLISSFDTTQKNVKVLINKVKNEADGLSGVGENLSSNMTETAAAMNEIAANIQGVKTRVVNQSASVTQAGSTMKQLVNNIDKLDGYIGDQSNYVSTASSAVEEMAANIRSVTDTLVKNSSNVKRLAEASEIGRSGINEVAADIQEIARESAGLMEINAVMENIASQTNLLSMNAAIEAAHAGDAGKGFAVVADEIRKLAESSSEQSKIIGAVLKKIKESIEKISKSNENVLSKFEDIEAGIRIVYDQEENIRHAMEEQDVGSQQVVKGIIEITEITHKVKNGSKEMLEGANEVIRESGNLENITREISDSMSEMVLGADQINSAVNNVNDLSGRNKSAISTLVKEVSLFRV